MKTNCYNNMYSNFFPEMRPGRLLKLRWFFLTMVCIVAVRWVLSYKYYATVLPYHRNNRDGLAQNSAFNYWLHNLAVKEYLSKRKEWNTSTLGTALFKNIRSTIEEVFEPKKDYFMVLIWKVGPALEKRHLRGHYGKKSPFNPLQNCSVQNCEFTYNDSAISSADAVLIHLHRSMIPGKRFQVKRNRLQRWIFLTDESPEHTFLSQRASNWRKYGDLFNWSMSYRIESDIPVPYGRVVPLSSIEIPRDSSDSHLISIIPNWRTKQRDVLVAILISNCGSKRMRIVRELMKHMKVQVYGRCSEDAKDACPGHFHNDCPEINKYYFYLAFENSRCNQYITEKVFYNAYSKGAIPVIIGTDSENAEQYLPPYSYIYAEEFRDVEKLAKTLIKIGSSDKEILSYHSWRRHFKVLNEHGYFGTQSVHYCRICQGLNYNDKSESIYAMDRLEQFLDPVKLCYTTDRKT